MTVKYPATVKADPASHRRTIGFPDLPEALTDGKDLEEALREAAECLGEALACRMGLDEHIPLPSDLRRGQRWVHVPLDLAPKVALRLAMQEQGVDHRDLAKRLGCTEKLVRSLLDPRSGLNPEILQKAFERLGKRVAFMIEDAA